tara:strand:+ start:1571 stop:2386 length:816 start_codon:yes stop_codon:yes gene_type:complete
MTIIAVANQKGGVGKTTTSINLAAGLADLGARVLLLDLDPQGNATMGSGIDKNDLQHSSYAWLQGEQPFDKVVTTSAGRFDVMPSNLDLTAAEVAMLDMERREYRIRALLQDSAERYDYILIDCPPSLNILTVNALTAANGVLIPMQCEYFALEGLTALLDTIEGIRAQTNSSLRIDGLLRTMYDPRNGLTRDVSRQLIHYFGNQVFRTVIPRNIRLAEAPSHGLPVQLYDRSSRGAVAYQALAAEVHKRHRPQLMSETPSNQGPATQASP